MARGTDGGWEKAWDLVGVATANGVLLAGDLGGNLVEPTTQGVDIAVELLTLVGVEVEGELLVALAFECIELRLDRGAQIA